MPEARNPELEAQILEDPEDPAAYLVYADWLQAAGDPRGKLIAAQAALVSDPGSEALAAAVKALLEEHGEAVLGADIAAAPIAFDWHCGFWRAARVGQSGWTPQPARDEDIAHLVASPSARFLRKAYCVGPFTPGVLAALAPLARTLRDLQVWMVRDKLEDEHLLALGSLVELRRLVLGSCEKVTARGMNVLSSLRHLEALDLRNCRLSDEGAHCLAGLPLARVMFNAVTQGLTAAGMSTLAAAPLRSLHLGAETIDDTHVAPLAHHPTLADLELPRARLTPPGARALGSLPRLHRLYLPSSTIDERGVRELVPHAGRLQVLYLGRSAISDVACEILSAFDRLAFLDVCSSGVTGAGLRALSRLRRLEHLDLSFLSIEDEDVRQLAPLASLRSLSLYTCRRITDRAIDTLEQLPLLARLDLGGAQITEHAIARLAELPHLVELGLEDCDGAVIERARQVERWYVNTHDSLEIYDELGERP